MRKERTVIEEEVICDLCQGPVEEDDYYATSISYFPSGATEPIVVDICGECRDEDVNICGSRNCNNYMHKDSTFSNRDGMNICRECAIVEKDELLALIADMDILFG